MSDLPPINQILLYKFLQDITDLKRGVSRERSKPHKLVLLLTVVELIENGEINENKVEYNEQLHISFRENFRQFCSREDWCQLAPPFFHLRTSGFWHHKIKTGHEEIYKKIKTSGGGSKRIKENIDYAYFSDDVYLLLQEKVHRHKIRNHLIDLLSGESSSKNTLHISEAAYSTSYLVSSQTINNLQNKAQTQKIDTLWWDMEYQRLKTVFHESFSLSRISITHVLEAFSKIKRRNISIDSLEGLLREETYLGTNYVKAMPRYALGTGLINSDYQLTLFGDHVLQCDKMLENTGTQWLLHYHLCAPHGPGPAFWHELVTTRFRSGDEFTSEEITEQIIDFVERVDGRRLSDRSARSTATIFVGTYTKSEALGKLGILEEIVNGQFRVLDPEPPPVWTLACALLDIWRAQFGERMTVNLDDLYQDHGLTQLFLIGPSRMNSALRCLSEEGYVEVHRIAPPYQVVLLRRDEEPLLRKMYGLE